MMVEWLIKTTGILMLSCLAFACSEKPKQIQQQIVTLTAQKFSNTLFYSGTVRPLKTIVIATPVEGTVIEMPVQYGEPVKRGQLLFILSSSKFMTEYKTGLMAYVKGKSEFNTARSQLTEAQFLHNNKLISDDDLKMKQSNYYTARLAFLQAEDTLKNLLQQLNIKDINLHKLSIADIDKVSKALHLQNDSKDLRVFAPVEGLLLSASKSDEENKKILKGDVIKQGEALAVIGDLSGLRVRIKVNELTVNQLHGGQKVDVTGIAFPEYRLQGEIERIDKQGETSNGGVPTFTVDIVVSRLTAAQQNAIHVGMSAKIAIDVDEGTYLMVPITALVEKNGTPFVYRYDEITGKVTSIKIQTGKTTANAVAVLSGLTEGEKIVIPR